MKHPERVSDYLGHIAQAIERAASTFSPYKTLKRSRETNRYGIQLYATSRLLARP
jgi:hypothetical protein